MSKTEERDHSDLRQSLQEDPLLDILQRQNGSLMEYKGKQIVQIGSRVKKEVNPRLIDDFREPIEVDDFTVGYITLLYELANDTTVGEALSDGNETGEDRLNNR